MRKFNIFTVFLITVLLAVTFALPVSALANPDIEADAALMVEVKSGKILYEKNKDTRVAPGGIAKVMTLLLAVEAVENGQTDLKDNITASKTFLNGIGQDAATQKIKPGEKMSYEDLMYCAILVSANDACNILAEEIDGSISGFVDRMNEKAEALGCRDTYFMNTGGLADAGQYTSSWDQYLIFKEAVAHPLFLEIAGTAAYAVKATNYSPERSLLNSNAMLRSDSDYFYQFCLAGKTGTLSENRNSLVAYAENDDLSLISIVFGAKPAGGTGSAARGFVETIRLFEWGFSGFIWQDIIKKGDIVASGEIALAKGIETIALKTSDTITVLARRDLKAEDIAKDVVIYGQTGDRGLSAPVKEGDILGRMTIYVDGQISGKVNLMAAENVELDKVEFIKSQISHTLSRFWVQLVLFLFLVLIVLYAWLVIRDRKKRREKKRKIEEAKRKIIEERQHQTIYK